MANVNLGVKNYLIFCAFLVPLALTNPELDETNLVRRGNSWLALSRNNKKIVRKHSGDEVKKL